jgi:hypothetical protein
MSVSSRIVSGDASVFVFAQLRNEMRDRFGQSPEIAAARSVQLHVEIAGGDAFDGIGHFGEARVRR